MENKKRSLRARLIKRGIPLYLMLLLPIAWYLIFCYIPMGGLVIAFQDYNIWDGFASPWLTDMQGNLDIFGHFKNFLTDDYFWRIVLNTLRLGFFNTLVCFPAPIVLALLFNEVRPGIFKKTTQTVSYLPYFVSAVALVSIITQMLSYRDGLFNNLIEKMGGERINFLIEDDWFLPIYVLLNLWRSVGWGTIIYMASISNVDGALYEAAAMDGAGRWRKMWHITLPHLKPQIIILLVLAVPGILGADFEVVLLLQQDQNLMVSDVLSTYVYRRGIDNGMFDYSTAVGLANSIINLILVVTANKIADKTSNIGLF